MPAGRKPLPSAIKILKGNPGKRPINMNEPKPSGIATCPEHLNALAREEWNRVSTELIALGLLTSVDRAAFAAYCAAYARWVDAEEKLAQTAAVVRTQSGNAIQNPYVGVANRAMEIMHKFASEFGLTPSSRSRLQVSVASTELVNDPFAEFLGAPMAQA